MKVIHISTHDHGGAGIAALRLHQGLRAAGIDSSMLVLSKQSSDSYVHSIGSVNAALLRWNQIAAANPNRRPDLEIFTDAICDIDLADVPEFRDADVVNLHWVAGLVNHSQLSRMLNGKPAVWTLHDMNAFTGGCHYNWECRKFEQRCGACPQLGSFDNSDISFQGFHRKLIGYTDANIVFASPSNWLAEEAHKSSLWHGRPVRVIPNGFPLETFRPYQRATIREDLGIALNRKVVLFGCDSLGNPRKGFHFLIEAARILSNEPGEKPLFCFFGQMPAQLQFPGESLPLGSISDPNLLAALYSMADAFVISSLQDNLPNVVPECLACGTPVVGFQIGGIPDMIQHQRTGFLVEHINASELAKGIHWTLDNADTSMRTRCRLFAESRFSQEIQANSYVELYKELLGTHSVKQTSTLGPKVNLGCGSRFCSTWENIDFVPAHPSVRQADLRQGIPLPDNYASVVYHSHVLEHFPKSEAPRFLMECYRVLQPDGILRIALPDLESIARLYIQNLEKAIDGDRQAEERYDWIMLEMFDQAVRNRGGGAMLDWWVAPELKAEEFIIERCGDEVRRVLHSIRSGNRPAVSPEPMDATSIGAFRLSGEIHQWMYDRFSLARLLKQCGFKNIVVATASESRIPDFTTFQLDTDAQGHIRKPDSFFMEATK